ncbi:hypothetical protein JCM8097_009521 [Rhodosporidiobolus ruineniae]
MPSASTTSTTTAATFAEGGIPTAVLHLRGTNDLVAHHEAAQQPLALDPTTGLRTDREYPAAYEGNNPEHWPVGRGVPDFRPLNTNVDAASRPLGASTDQRVFVTLMMSGVWAMGRMHSVWAGTVGRMCNDLLEYPVGGQF